MCGINSTSLSCGFGGSCSTQGVCVCEENWRFVPEFVFSEEDEQICGFNLPLIYVLYSFLLLIETFCMLNYALSIKKKSQLKRLIPFYVYSFLCFILAVIKLIDPLKSFSNDRLMGFFLGFGMFGLNATMHMFLYKYISFQYKALKVVDKQYLDYAKKLNWVGALVTVGCFFAMCFFCAVPFISKEFQKTREALTRFGCGLMILSCLFYIFGTTLAINRIIEIMKTISYPLEKLHMALGSLRVVRRSAVWFHVLALPLYVAAVSSADGLRIFTYGTPIIFIYSALGFTVTLYGNRLARPKKIKLVTSTEI